MRQLLYVLFAAAPIALAAAPSAAQSYQLCKPHHERKVFRNGDTRHVIVYWVDANCRWTIREVTRYDYNRDTRKLYFRGFWGPLTGKTWER